MKYLLLSGLIFCSTFLRAQEIQSDIRVSEVTVYLSGAKVYGHTAVSLKKGNNTIKLTRLPDNLDDNTYKVYLDKNTTLLSVRPGMNTSPETEHSDEQQTREDTKKTLQRETDLLAIRIHVLEGEKQLINANLKISESDITTPQEQLRQLSAFYSDRMLAIEKELFALREKTTALRDTLSGIDHQIREAESRLTVNRKELTLEIFSSKEMVLDLGLSYIVSDAGWVPSYDLRAQNTRRPLEIVYKGKIYQRTGQHWKDVKLFVSTYRPSSEQNRPILHPLYISVQESYNALNGANVKSVQSVAYANAYQMAEKERVTGDIFAVQVAAEQMNMLYELTFKQTILSQDQEQYVILDKKETEAEYKYHAVPKLSNQVFLMAFISGWETLNFISGEANIYYEDNYVGKTHIDSRYTKDRFPVSLGADERIIIRRDKIHDKKSTQNLGTGRSETALYQITVRNNSNEAVELEILDQLPLSQNSRISVKKLEIEDGTFDEKTGSILWYKTLAVGSTQTINFSYEIRYPKDMQVHYHN